jgi:hypothetical protein
MSSYENCEKYKNSSRIWHPLTFTATKVMNHGGHRHRMVINFLAIATIASLLRNEEMTAMSTCGEKM